MRGGVSMSCTYKIAESFCMFLNHHFDGYIKKKMTEALTDESYKSDKLPKSIYQKFCVINERLEGCPIYVISRSELEPEGAILFLHGGGGMIRPTKMHFDTVMKLAEQTNCKIYLAYYPLSPKAKVSEQLVWCEKVYKHMLRSFEAKQITFVGDSAGANLCISLCERIKSKPAKMIVISMAAGLDNNTGRQMRLSAEHKDPILSVEMNDVIAENWAGDVPLDSPDINPSFVTYKDFP